MVIIMLFCTLFTFFFAVIPYRVMEMALHFFVCLFTSCVCYDRLLSGSPKACLAFEGRKAEINNGMENLKPLKRAS